MTLPSTGLTAEVFREMMPPYHLSTDLLHVTIATLCPPPRGTPAAWYEARLARVTDDISTLMPANAAQAATASDIVIARDMANTLVVRAQERELTLLQMGRLFNVADRLKRTAEMLKRGLERTQQKPAPFFGTVLADEVDVVAAAAAWRERRDRAEAAADAEDAAGGSGDPRVEHPRTSPTEGAAVAGMAASTAGSSARGQGLPGMTMKEAAGARPREASAAIEPRVNRPGAGPVQLSATPEATAAEEPARRDASPEAAIRVETDARSSAEGVVTRLDQGPGWTLEVVRPRVAVPAGTETGGGAGALPVTAAVLGGTPEIDPRVNRPGACPMQLSALSEATTAPGQPSITASTTHDVGSRRQAEVAP